MSRNRLPIANESIRLPGPPARPLPPAVLFFAPSPGAKRNSGCIAGRSSKRRKQFGRHCPNAIWRGCGIDVRKPTDRNPWALSVTYFFRCGRGCGWVLHSFHFSGVECPHCGIRRVRQRRQHFAFVAGRAFAGKVFQHHLKDQRPNLKLIAVREGNFLHEPCAVDEGAVAAAEIAQKDPIGRDAQQTVLARHPIAIGPNMTFRAAAEDVFALRKQHVLAFRPPWTMRSLTVIAAPHPVPEIDLRLDTTLPTRRSVSDRLPPCLLP